jgi:hypothetical protein
MNVDQYEVIGTLERTISSISRNEQIDRTKVLRCLQERLAYQQRRIEAFMAIGWIDDFEPTKLVKGRGDDGL